MNTAKISFDCSISVADLLLCLSGKKHLTSDEIKKVPLGLPDGAYRFIFGWSDALPEGTDTSTTLTGVASEMIVMLVAAQVFVHAYEAPPPVAPLTSLYTPPLTGHEVWLKRRNRFGEVLPGDVVSTPFFERFEIDTEAKTVFVTMGN